MEAEIDISVYVVHSCFAFTFSLRTRLSQCEASGLETVGRLG